MSYTHLKLEISDLIATVTLNRPEARNAISEEMRVDLDHALAELKAKAGEEVKAVILTGAGGHFCAGGDVKGMATRRMNPMEHRARMRSGHNRIYDIAHLGLPVISLVDGAAAGAGANIALLADFVLATPRAYFMQAFARIGLVPDWAGFFTLPRLVGIQRAKELVYSGRRVYAEEAKEIGMILDIVGQDTAMDEAREFAGRFTHASSDAIAGAKSVLNQAFQQDFRTLLEMEADVQCLVRETDFHKEAVRRFKDKETPLYDWEKLAGLK
jgi:2-(1,2-epoxy-1,2-dihydrophenyl)acetyl-CoA isomerase